MPGLTAALGSMVSSLTYEQLPAEVAATAKLSITDCTAALLAGRDQPVSRLMAEMVQPQSSGEARLLFDRGYARAPDAALVNGCASHCLEYDDPTLFHVSAVLVPAVLAEAEACHSSGREMIAAYTAGYEVWSELMSRDQDRHHDKGWHPTGVFGTLGAAACASRLNRLDAERSCAALSIAASMAAGLVPNFGTMTKPFHAGRAAQNGILAARLAKRGMTAAPDVLEHPRGFLAAISPAGRVRTDADIAAGREWHMLSQGLSIRRYPMCYATNRAIDATLGLVARHKFAPDAVEDIEVTMGRAQYIPLRYQHPRTPLEARFSINFAVACAIVAGRVTLAELTEDFIAHPALHRLFSKLRVVTIDGFDPDFPMSLLGPYDRVKVTLAGGSVLDSGPLRFPKGHMRNPLTREELFAKFRECSSNAFSAPACALLFERLQGLEQQAGTQGLYELGENGA